MNLMFALRVGKSLQIRNFMRNISRPVRSVLSEIISSSSFHKRASPSHQYALGVINETLLSESKIDKRPLLSVCLFLALISFDHVDRIHKEDSQLLSLPSLPPQCCHMVSILLLVKDRGSIQSLANVGVEPKTSLVEDKRAGHVAALSYQPTLKL